MIKKPFFIFNIILAIFFGTVLIFTGGYYYGKLNFKTCPAEKTCAAERVCPAENVDLSLFWEAWKKLEENFIDKEKIDTLKMVYGAIAGLTNSLEDPHTIFLSPEEKKKFLEDVKGRFEGIGIEIGVKNGELMIIAPLEGSPAKKAGLRAGDKILKINDNFTTELSLDKAITLIRGPKGTEVTLTIWRKEWEKPKEIKIIRDVIFVPSLKWELKEGNIAYIKIYQFSQQSSLDFKRTATEILKSPAKKIILDLRDNPGGYLEVAREIAGWFLEKNQIVTIEDFGEAKEKKNWVSFGPSKFKDYPMIVLINKGSASASEILAGALRDNRNILLIGEKTFGKGSVQELFELKGESALKITIARWLTPKGKVINETGLEPDIKIEMNEEDLNKEKDSQLEKAIEIIRKM